MPGFNPTGLNPLEFGADQLAVFFCLRCRFSRRLNPLEFGADQLADGLLYTDMLRVLIPSNSGLISWPSLGTQPSGAQRLNPLEFGADQLALPSAPGGVNKKVLIPSNSGLISWRAAGSW